MSVVESVSTALARVQVLTKSGIPNGLVFAALGAALLAQSVGSARPASADQIGDVQAQAQQLASQIASQSARIHALTEQYDQAELQVQQLQQQVQSARTAIAQARSQVSANLAELRRQAVYAYIQGSVAPGSLSVLVSRNPDQAALREEYLSVANGNVEDTVDSLHIAEAVLKGREAQLESAESAAAGAADGLDQDRQALTSEVAQEQATLDQVQGQLATLVAQAEEQRLAEQQAQQAAAAAQRQQQAAQQQAEEAASRSQPSSPPSPPGGGQPTSAGLATVAAPPPSFGGGSGGGGSGGGGAGGDAFAEIRQCESGGNYSADTGNGYYGAYQISAATWASLGYSGLPSQAPPSVQDAAAQALQARAGWGQWPTCAAMLGLI